MLDKNKLQLLSHAEPFKDRVEAMTYIADNFTPESVLGEPAVVFYGDYYNPNAILVIGLGNGKIYPIDTAELKEKISSVEEKNDGVKDKVEDNLTSIKEIIKAVGLELDDNKINDKISYTPDKKDEIIGEAKNVAEALDLLSKNLKELSINTKFTIADTNSVKLVFNTEGDENVLKAKVKISDNGDSDEEDFNNNILGIKKDGLYAAVHLEYDEDKNELKFYSSGIKNGKFQDDAKKQVIKLGKHLELAAKNSDENPIKVNVETEGNISKVSANIALSERDNILKITDGKLTASVSLFYNESNSQLTFNNGVESKTFTLNTGSIVERSYYDANSESIVIVFRLINGNTSDVKIPVRDMLNEWGVDNTNKSVTLVKTIDEGSGKDLLSADINISEKSNNILVKDGNALYVGGISSNIKYKTTTVAKTLDELEKTNVKFAQDLLNEVTNRTNEVEKVLNQLEKEIENREHADDDIKHLLEDLEKELDITELKEELKKFEDGYLEFEKEWASYKPQIEKAIADAESVAGRVAELEKSLEVTNTNLVNLSEKVMVVESLTEKVNNLSEGLTSTNGEVSALKERVATAEGNINNNTSKIADNTLAITNEATLARQNESDIKNALENEVTRATAKDEELASGVSSNKSDIETLKINVSTLQSDLTSETERAKGVENTLTQSVENIKSTADQNKSDIANNLQKLNDEINRATSKETEIEGKVSDEVNRAKGEENRLETLINNNKEGIAENKTSIGTLSTSVAGLRNELENEVTRATREEKRIEEKIDTLASSSKEASDNALEQAKNYIDAEILKATASASEDASSKANKALEDAKTYSDEKLALEVERAKAAEETNANAIVELKAKDTEIEANVAKKVETVRVEKNSVSDLQYTLYVDDKPCGEINIPKDQFLKDVRYDKGTTSLVFTWEIGDEHPETSVDVSDFLTTYNAGNGLKLEDYVFSVKLTTANESYLQVTEDGIQLVGIDAKFDTKVDKSDVYTKLEVDNAIEIEAIRAKGVENGLQNSIGTINNNLTSLTERVATTEGKLNIIQGNSAQEGSIEYALAQAKNHADNLVSEEVTRAQKAEKDAEDNAKAYTDELAIRVSANEDAIGTLNGNFAVVGSVANAIYQSNGYTDEKISEVNDAIAEKVNSVDVYTKTEADGKFLTEHQDISELVETVAKLNGNDAVEGSVANGLKQAKKYTDESVADKISKVEVEKDEAGLNYNIKTDGVVVGSINIPKDQFLKDVKYDADTKNIVFVWNLTDDDKGIAQTTVNVNDLVDTYIAGNGISIVDNEITIDLDDDDETNKYLTIGKGGLKLQGIDTEFAKKVDTTKLDDFYTKSDADEKFLTEHQDISNLVTLEKTNELIETETNRAKTAEQANADAITSLQSKDSELQDEIIKKIGKVEIKSSTGSDLVYNLWVDDKMIDGSTINIPKDQFLKDVSYDNDTKSIRFIFETTIGEKTTYVSVADLVDTYQAGSGLKLEGNKFSVSISDGSEGFLQVDESGIRTNGLKNALDSKIDKTEVYTKDEIDGKDFVNNTTVSTLLADKVNVSDVYTKEQIDNKGYLVSSDVENLATKAEVENETERAKIAEGKNETAIEAVKTTADKNALDIIQLQKDVVGLEPSVEETNSVKMIMNKTANGVVYSSDVKLDLEKANILKVSGNGLYAEVSLEYNTVENKLTFVAGGVEREFQLAGASTLQDAYYNSANRQLVFLVTLQNNETKQVIVDVNDLINTLRIENHANSPIQLTLTQDAQGNDLLSANVIVSTKEDNAILSDNGTLYVSKRAANLTALWGENADKNLQVVINEIKTRTDSIDEIKSNVGQLKTDVSELTKQVNENTLNITNINKTLNEYNTRLEKVEGDVTNIQESLTSIQETITNIQNEIGGSGEGEMSIKDRLAALEEICNNLIDFGTYN